MVPRTLRVWLGASRAFASSAGASLPPFAQLLDQAQHSQEQRRLAVDALSHVSSAVLAQHTAAQASHTGGSPPITDSGTSSEVGRQSTHSLQSNSSHHDSSSNTFSTQPETTGLPAQTPQSEHVLPPVQSLNELLRLCADANDVEGVFKVIDVLERHGVPADEETFVQLSSAFQYFPKSFPNE